MKKESYDKVGIVSVLLKEKLKELSKCQEEKEAILREIVELTRKNKYEQNIEVIKAKMKKMKKHLRRF